MEGHPYIVLDDMTSGFKAPCVMDLKMGKRSYDEDATPEKVAREIQKYPQQNIIGFRFAGMVLGVLYMFGGEYLSCVFGWTV